MYWFAQVWTEREAGALYRSDQAVALRLQPHDPSSGGRRPDHRSLPATLVEHLYVGRQVLPQPRPGRCSYYSLIYLPTSVCSCHQSSYVIVSFKSDLSSYILCYNVGHSKTVPTSC